KFTSQEGESLESYYPRFYKMMNELVRNQCIVTNHQVNVQFLLQLKPKWQSRANQDNSPRINRGTGYDNQRAVNVAGARENVAKDTTYHKEKMLLCKQEEAGVQLNTEQADWKDDTDDESDDQGTWHRFKRVLQTLLIILDPSLMLSHCIRHIELDFCVLANLNSNFK
ncbi:hypothetical protein Tco_0041612, partial [Tanacetum coccineum]